MLAAAHYVNSFKPKKVIAAAPVGTEEACSRLKKLSDHCVCLATPKGFHAVGQCYLDFTQVTDDEVRQILEQNDQRSWLEQQGPLTGAPP
jgi:predicted phosphoribosyltransferase